MNKPNIYSLLILTGISAWAWDKAGHVFENSTVQFWPGLFAFMTVFFGFEVIKYGLEEAAGFIDWLASYRPTGKGGTASWATFEDIKQEISNDHHAPFWGRMAQGEKTALSINYDSNALTVAPAGSGKGIYTVVPNILAIWDSKIIPDFKGELCCIAKKELEDRGERVVILNPARLWSDQVGIGDSYNPIDIIVDDLYRPDGLLDVSDDLREITAQLLPEPGQEETDNSYFREGSRRIIADAIVIQAMVDEYDATLASAALLIEDRSRLEYHLRWIIGVDLKGEPLPEGPMPIEAAPWAQHHDMATVIEFSAYIRARADNLLKLMTGPDNRTFESFISGAQQSIAHFAFGRLSSSMGRSTFSMNDLKGGDQPVALFILADSSRPQTYGAYVGLLQWCAFTAIKRHPNKKKPVYAIADECTNAKVNGLADLLTWGRGYGLRMHLIFQDFSAFERVYGKTALETLLSETEIKQYLPGQRSPKTLELIEKQLGEQSVMAGSFSNRDGSGGFLGGLAETTSESPRPLMKADEIRRSKQGILIVRQCQVVLVEPVSYAEIDPFRDVAGINPFHGSPFLKPIKIKF